MPQLQARSALQPLQPVQQVLDRPLPRHRRLRRKAQESDHRQAAILHFPHSHLLIALRVARQVERVKQQATCG